MKRMAIHLLCFLVMALVATGAGATRMEALGVSDMAVEADTIALGQCVEGYSKWVDGTLVTMIKIEVEESLKGAGPQHLTLVVPGGVDVDRPFPVAVTFPGAPVLFDGEDVLLFLSPSERVADAYRIVGFSQGKYSVVDDGAGGRIAAQGRYSGSNGLSLDELKAQIREALGQN